MKALKILFFCTTIFLSYSIKAQTYSSEHDKTIEKLIPKAKKNKLNDKQLNTLEHSFHQANEEDHQKIMKLKMSGEADIWPEIYFRLTNIDKRQSQIKVLPNDIKNAINFKALDLNNDIASAKEKAELYLCAKINLLLKEPGTENLNEVRNLVNTLDIINPHNHNIDDFRLKTTVLPSKNIMLRIGTLPKVQLPSNFAQLALNFDDKTIYGIPFDTEAVKDKDYDLTILIIIEETIISPERIDAVTFEEKKDDMLAKVTDKTMSKTATIRGHIEYIDVKNENVLIKTPINISSTFIHNYAEYSGDKAACSAKTLELIQKQVVDFPSNEVLIKDTARKLNSILKNLFQKK